MNIILVQAVRHVFEPAFKDYDTNFDIHWEMSGYIECELQSTI